MSLFMCYNIYNYYRRTGIKVYRSDIKTDVYNSDQNRVNLPFECNLIIQTKTINDIITPVGGDKWQKSHWIINLRDFSNTETNEVFLVGHWIICSNWFLNN